MNEFVLVIAGSVIPVVLISVWGIIFLTVWHVLRQNRLFEGKTAAVAALCVSFLCMVGLYQWLCVEGGHERVNSSETNLNLLLLPYAALAVAVIAVLLFMLFSRSFRVRESKRSVKESRRRQGPIYPSKRLRKDDYSQTRNPKEVDRPFWRQSQ
jgi:hypothetical protein